MLYRVLIARLVLLVLLTGSSVAANSQEGAVQAEQITIAGCLQKGINEGEFTLVADDKQAYQVHPLENLELQPHADHRVELTGTVEKTDTHAVLKASALKMVAESCGV